MMRRSPLFVIRGLLMLVPVVTLLAGCTPLARVRTLPPSVRSVYVPMVVNRTAEPGVEERVTVALQEELLADGRLSVVREREADAVVKVTLTDWQNRASAFDDDSFPTGQLYDVEAVVVIEENIPGHPAIGGNRTVRTVVSYNADPRSITFNPEPETKDTLYRQLARQLVLEILTGDYSRAPLTEGERPAEQVETRPAI